MSPASNLEAGALLMHKRWLAGRILCITVSVRVVPTKLGRHAACISLFILTVSVSVIVARISQTLFGRVFVIMSLNMMARLCTVVEFATFYFTFTVRFGDG